MKRQLYTYIILIFGIVASMGLAACQDIFDGEDCETPGHEGNGVYRVMAIRVYDAAIVEAATSRATNFDSDYEDLGEVFNKGLQSERAVFNGYTSLEESPHYIMFFNDNGDTIDMLALSEWDFTSPGESNEDTGVSYYTTLYAVQANAIPEPFQKPHRILVVLNASNQLAALLRASRTYEDAYSLVASADINSGESSIADPDDDDSQEDDDEETATNFVPDIHDYLYYIAEDGTRYFTMSSSMVIKEENNSKSVVPANISRSLQWYPNMEQAAANPGYSMFVERLQAKFTLLIKRKSDSSALYYLLDRVPEMSTPPTEFIPVNKLILTSETDFDPDKDLTFKYVKEYTRGPSIDEIQPLTIQSTKNWKVNIIGWGVNATEKKEYLFKQLDSDGEYYEKWNPTTDGISDYRNFWAEGYNYYTIGDFPDQYRPNTDNERLKPGYSNAEFKSLSGLGETSSLNYFNFTDLSKKTSHHYAPEHTFPVENYFKTSDPKKSQELSRKGTHVVVTAQMLIEGFDHDNVYNSATIDNSGLVVGRLNGEDLEAESKLVMNDIYWTESAYKEYVAEYLGFSMLDPQNQQSGFEPIEEMVGDKSTGKYYNYTILDPDNDGNFYTAPGAANERNLAYGSYFRLVRLYIEGGDSYVYIMPNAGVELYTRNRYNGTYTRFYSDNDPEGQKLFLSLVFQNRDYFARNYRRGCMYYALPVRHNPDGVKHTELELGDYGVVRNHWYYFTIDNVFAPGTPVDRLNEEIVPNNEPFYESLGVNLSVLPWHDIVTDVDISGQRPTVNPKEIDADLNIKADDWEYNGGSVHF